MDERRIPRVWKKVAYLTKLFQSHQIADIVYSSASEDETSKALTMLRRYMERGGTRQKLAGALENLGLIPLSQDVRSRYFINTGEE